MVLYKYMQLCNDHNKNVEPVISGCKKQQGVWLSEIEGFLYMCLLTNGLTHSELQCWGSGLKSVKHGGTELSRFRAGFGKAAFPQTKVLAEAIFPLLSPPSS